MEQEEKLRRYGALVDGYLKGCFTGNPPQAKLYEAMRYSLLAGGKRIRPVLALECCVLCGGEPETALPFACAVEMLHTYSLIHDDLPCMDDDDLRRGRPTSHRVFGEAAAVLAGDALQAAAFEWMLRRPNRRDVPAERAAEAAWVLARAAGADGMAGGQMLDMESGDGTPSLERLTLLHELKTGAMIAAAAEIGCIVGGGNEEQRAALRRYAEKLGLAFQIRDDILDVTGSSAAMGKNAGSDRAGEKATFASLLGLEECARRVDGATEEAKAALEGFSNAEFLRWLADRLAKREK